MSKMVKRVADAIREVNNDTIGLSYTELTEAMARAAIDAMRKPTPEMRAAAAYYLGGSIDISDFYSAMIDAALALSSPERTGAPLISTPNA